MGHYLSELNDGPFDDPREIPTPTDEQALLAAIIANPDDDTPRVMLADILTERGAVRVERPKCATCNGTGRVKVSQVAHEKYHKIVDYLQTGSVPIAIAECPYCKGENTILDNSGPDHAEYIRLQCRIAAIQKECGCGGCVKLRGGGQHHNGPCGVDRRQDDGVRLRLRERELLAANRERWQVKCPVCHGKWSNYNPLSGETEWTAAGTQEYHDCKTGYLGVPTRGFLESLPVRWEWIAELERVRCEHGCHFDNPKRIGWKHRRGCPGCLGRGEVISQPDKFVPTDFARTLTDGRFPLLRSLPLVGKEPLQSNDIKSGWFYWRSWNPEPGESGLVSHNILHMLFDRLKGGESARGESHLRFYPTRELGVAVLGRAVWEWVKG